MNLTVVDERDTSLDFRCNHCGGITQTTLREVVAMDGCWRCRGGCQKVYAFPGAALRGLRLAYQAAQEGRFQEWAREETVRQQGEIRLSHIGVPQDE